MTPGAATCLDVFIAAPIERVTMLRDGVSASWAETVLGSFMRKCGRDLSVVRLSRATMKRKALRDACLSLGEGERVLGIAGLIGQIEMMMKESGSPDGFDASDWLVDWATSPLPAFGGARPIEFLDTGEGRIMVSQLLAQMQSGAYA